MSSWILSVFTSSLKCEIYFLLINKLQAYIVYMYELLPQELVSHPPYYSDNYFTFTVFLCIILTLFLIFIFLIYIFSSFSNRSWGPVNPLHVGHTFVSTFLIIWFRKHTVVSSVIHAWILFFLRLCRQMSLCNWITFFLKQSTFTWLHFWRFWSCHIITLIYW